MSTSLASERGRAGHKAAQRVGALILSLVIILVAWSIGSVIVGADVVPGPRAATAELWGLVRQLDTWQALGVTLLRSVVAFAVSLILACLHGILAFKFERYDDLTSGALNILLFSPPLAIALGGVLLLGRDHLYQIVVVVAALVTPTLAVYMRDALRDVDRDLLQMAASYKVPTISQVLSIYLPWLLPALLSASRLGFSLASGFVMLVEIFGFPGGVGFRIANNYQAYNLADVLAWLMLFVCALLLIEQGIRLTERKLVRWE